jgi:Tol biopolymer transport system component/DNA-binding winged helix-turn-helix (wHTH) protein
MNNGPLYRFGLYTLDGSAAQLRKTHGRAEEEVALTVVEFQILEILVKNFGQLVTYKEIANVVWPNELKTADDQLISRIQVHVSHLKEKIGDNGSHPKLIENIARRGYRFVGDVHRIQSESIAEDTLRYSDGVLGKQDSLNSKPTIIRTKLTVLWFCIGGVVVIAAVAFWLARSMTFFPRRATVDSLAQLTTGSGLTLFPAISPDGSRIAYSSDHHGSFEIHTKLLAQDSSEIQLTDDGEQNFQPAWSQDGQRIAYYSKNRGGIWELPATGGKARQLTTFGSRPAWAPNGSMIAFQSNALTDLGSTARNALPPSTLWIVSVQDGQLKQLTQPGTPNGGHGAPSWSPDGRRIVFEVDQFDESSVWSISINGDNLTRISPGRGYDPIYAPDGRTVYFALNGLWEVRVSPDANDPVSAPTVVTRPTGPTELRYPTVSADGKKLVYNDLAQKSNIWSLALLPAWHQSTTSYLTDEVGTRNSAPAFSPDGTKIAYDSARIGASIDLWLMNADGSERSQLTTHPGPNDFNHISSWLPNNEVGYVAMRGGQPTYRAITIVTRRERLLLDLGSDLDYCRLSPDGTRAAFARKRGGPLNTWVTPIAGGEPRQLTFDDQMAAFPVWSPDGKWLAIELKRKEDTQIAIIPSDGGSITQLTFGKGQSWPYSWSPDGDKIAFAGFREGYWNLWWVSRSKEQYQLTDYKKLNAFVRYPAWSPLGNQIAYEYTETTGNIWMMELR